MFDLKQEDIGHDFILDEEFFENFTSSHTRKSYLNDINQFLCWISDYYKLTSFDSIERIHVIKYRNYLSEFGGHNQNPSTPKTINRKLASLSAFFKYLVEKNLLKANPVASVRRPRSEVKSPTNALNKQQVLELLYHMGQNEKSKYLHLALFTTFFTTGLRKSEILNLRFKDYQEQGNNKILQYRAKGGKLGKKVLNPIAIKALDEYIQWMNECERETGENDWLFQPTRNPSDPTNLNKPINPRTINELLDKYAQKAGIGFKVTPHSARATFIGELLEIGVDIYTIAIEVGHASVKTTGEYDKRRNKIKESPTLKLNWE
ncbi:tyrosine-type recombinase/integrase [Halobacteriovorax sp. RZ-1]|uniref:tyrosine-type recombinase/integrase n=1 Tax=unclassified Halobacteriovorax TaxID=2639665 RepID=UPI0037113A06